MRKRVLALILALVMCLSLLPAGAFAAPLVDSGECGENLRWTLEDEGTLIISGNSEMTNYFLGNRAPWYKHREIVKKIIVADGVKSIGNYAFDSCENAVYVNIPDTVKSIGKYAFSYCSSLPSVTVPEKVESIGEKAFEYCSALTELNYNARAAADFSDKSDVFFQAGKSGEGISFVFGDSVEKIPSYLFPTYDLNNMPKIKSVILGSNVVSIGSYAFKNCSGIESLMIPEKVTSIGNGAFYNCVGLKELRCNAKAVADLADNADVFCNAGVADPGMDVIFGGTVEKIPANLFRTANENFHARINSVTMPASLKTVGECAFLGTNVKSVNISDLAAWCGVNFGSYGSNPLYYAHDLYVNGSKLTDLVIPSDVTAIGSYAFNGCSIKSVTIPASLKSVGEGAFDDCSDLERVDISDLAAWCGISFEYCDSNPLYYAEDLFVNGSKLTELTIPDGITAVGDYAFAGCSMTSVTIPEGVTIIGTSAFEGCSYLLRITIPQSLESVGEDAFYWCSDLERVDISDLAAWCGISFESSSANPLSNISSLYLDGSKLTEISIPDTVESIGKYQFYHCGGLKKVMFPSSANSIGDSAFSNCWSLESARFEGNAPTSFGSSVFSGCASGFKILAPEDDDTWKDPAHYGSVSQKWYGYRIEFIDPVIGSGECGDDLVWSVLSDGTLNISGTGDMRDYSLENKAPWLSCGVPIKAVNIGDGVTSVGSYAFYCCTDLNSVSLGKDLENIGDWSFCGCTGLIGAVIPDSVSTVENHAFCDCAVLSQLTLGSGVEAVGNYAFCGCSALADIEIPASVTSLGYCAFSDTAFYNNETNWKNDGLYIGTWLVEVKSSVMYDFAVKKGTVGIANCASMWCEDLVQVEIPDSVTIIGDSAFSGCVNLCNVMFDGSAPTLFGSCVFDNCAPDFLICVPYNNVTWLNEDFDSDNGTWNGYPIEFAHTHIYTDVVTKPTCTKAGYTKHTCFCGDSYKDHEIPALGHDYKNGECTRCGAKAAKPGTPTVTLSTVTSSGKIKVSWKAVTGAAKYEVYRSTDNKTFKKLGTTTSTSYTNTSATAGTKYYYKVRAVSAEGAVGSYSKAVSKVCDLAQPVVTLSNVTTSGKIKVSWDKVTNASKYEVYRATSSSGTYKKLKSTTSTSYTDTSAKAGSKYYYKVKAICSKTSDANSAYSAVKYLVCDLAKPTAKIALSSGHPKVTWAKIDGASKYEVYRATSKSGTYTKLTTTSSASYTDKKAKAGKTYYYKVKAVCSKTTSGNSAYSSIVSIKAK